MSATEHSQEWEDGYNAGFDAYDDETDAAARRFQAYLLAVTLVDRIPAEGGQWAQPGLDTWAQWFYYRVYGTAMPAPKPVQEQKP